MSSEKNDGKPIVPKKGVTNEHFISVTEKTQNNITLSKLNEHYNQNLLKGNDAKQTEKENIEKINRSSNFVLPIVAIGVSIPLIGLLVIGFYKCGAEWWQHRHYRRMDFLIDGMYNN
ncbi:hypothetical protein HHI36_011207 [Cryptolaemus montrouzieri]|uniref:Uncharacterized protein n=1 Tax=Cryptolaemus montrouzieri TaxID=559131 RepID=A0ABD2ML21_9CUCU